MAFPNPDAVIETDGTAAATNKVCNLPASIAAGNFLFLVLRSAGGDTHSTPSGWSSLVLNNTADGSDDTTSIFYKQSASGSEGGSVTVNGTASLKFSSTAARISGHDPNTTPAIAGPDTGASTTPTTPSLTPVLGGESQDFLWIAIAAYEGEQTDPPTYPADSTLGRAAGQSGTGGAIATNCRNAQAMQQLNAATENPDDYTISVSDQWSGWTVAIFPLPPTRRAEVSWAELEVPLGPRRAQVSWAEFEVPLGPRRAQVSWSEFEVPTAPRRAEISWTELEVPLGPRRCQISWAELEVPNLVLGGDPRSIPRSYLRIVVMR